MKRLLLLIPVMLLARENPFFLPNELPKKTSEIPRSVDQTPNAVKKNLPKKVLHSSKQKSVQKELLKLVIKPATIYIYTDHLLIKTQSKLIRSFFTTKPKKLVLDFAGNKSFRTVKQKVKTSDLFVDIAAGSHKDYFRIALQLKKACAKKIVKTNEGYLVSCK
ncbi:MULTISPECIES: AMIN domain-containing protein [unclassified Nitratiruptor]|uniref:AMIN domain-containing protein n=1 Tax=unclassified Nitratiruptor TaxID=2624044 RepID=UPI0019160C56|nr:MULTISPECIES: AMIN domain-containing protein [unclassified Nitratiruptor]BCD60956.1 hypothetical protein NitYY0810_C1734 [Nitratiruptor sp. YY08-10]BCD64888.1 hypothetical protein NitYY0814_C1742 [Nitratiruptor sp. YY08-14]